MDSNATLRSSSRSGSRSSRSQGRGRGSNRQNGNRQSTEDGLDEFLSNQKQELLVRRMFIMNQGGGNHILAAESGKGETYVIRHTMELKAIHFWYYQTGLDHRMFPTFHASVEALWRSLVRYGVEVTGDFRGFNMLNVNERNSRGNRPKVTIDSFIGVPYYNSRESLVVKGARIEGRNGEFGNNPLSRIVYLYDSRDETFTLQKRRFYFIR